MNPKKFKIILILYFIIQVFFVLFSDIEYKSDSLGYYIRAVESIESGSIYPAPLHLYADYITPPLFTNIQILILILWNSVTSIAIFNIILMWLQVYLVYQISSNLFNETAAYTAVILFILYLNNLGLILLNLSEPLFNVFTLASVYFYLKKTNSSLFLSGIFAAASVGVRAAGFVLIAVLLIIPLYNSFRYKIFRKYYIFFAGGVLLFFLLFGSFIYYNFGQFLFTSTNGPVNLLIGANDDATGAYNYEVFEEGNAGFIEQPEKLTYIEKEKIWGDAAYKWIKENPVKWISIFPMKLAHIFLWDDYAVSVLMDKDWNLYNTAKTFLKGDSFDDFMPGKSLFYKSGFIALLIIHHLFYYLLLVISMYAVYKYFRSKKKNKYATIVLLYTLTGLFTNLMFFGDPRFKYSFLILMMILVSPHLNRLFLKKSRIQGEI